MRILQNTQHRMCKHWKFYFRKYNFSISYLFLPQEHKEEKPLEHCSSSERDAKLKKKLQNGCQTNQFLMFLMKEMPYAKDY